MTYPLRGIRARLAVLFTAGFAVLLGLGAVVLYLRLAARYRADVDAELRHTAVSARGLFDHDRGEYATTAETAAHLLTELVFADRTLVAVDSLHRRIATTLPYGGAPLLDDLDLRLHAPAPTTVSLQSGAARVLEVPLPDGVRLLLALPLAPLEERLRDLRLTLALGLPLVLLAGALLGGAASRVVLRPLVVLADAAGRIGNEVLHDGEARTALPPAPVPDEIGRLTSALEGMIARGNSALRREREAAERQRAFLADAAHELRTPVAIIRSVAEASLAADADPAAHRAALGSVALEAGQLGGLVADLLALAREQGAEAGADRERCFLDDVAHDVVRRARRLPAAEGRTITIGEFAEAPVVANRPLVERAVLALVHNALLHAPGSAVELSTGQESPRTTHDSRLTTSTSWLRVRDWGPGIPEAERERVFERFTRLDPRAGGSGLGLAIARQVAQVHGGTLTLESPPDGGAAFVLALPAR